MVNVAVMEKQHDTKVAPLVTLTDVPLSEKSAVEHTVQLPILPMPSLPRSTFSKRLTHLPGLKRLVGKNSDHILPVADDFDLRSPPPSYAFVDISPTAQSGSQASFRPQISISVHPPSSHGSLSIAKSNLAIESPVIASPIRTSSFGPYNLSPATPKTKAALPTEKLPRLMVVDNTFQPNLPDELTIHVGETLQMMAEYEDEWCLVQRVGGLGGELGVIPRFCLRECSES
ncbi:hypothetical protein CERSUDRAFT_93761 [Gelatoporia subvermispora B]|uniref:SH3 domain-containing protein n=1 Tax=Ceriporiopsis subvermispora (strain B) TaxID=914234 RepID=M2R133_CERS8|nr:hypothetical protein CERSUDRAFT_93761 [Gelatoporia subvermispora B]